MPLATVAAHAIGEPMRFLTATLLLTCALAANAAEAPPLPPALAGYQGKLVYLDFWASWCGPCAESFPWLNRMHDKYGADLVVVGVNVDESARAADGFLAKHPARFDIVRDPAGKLPEHYRIEGMPSSVLIGADGRVLHQHSGFRAEQADEYEAAIRAALPRQEARK
jgi:cytochrome c biogenesis protein CcmG/thiol:disulfide interchange protein DsbE